MLQYFAEGNNQNY